MSYLDRIKFCNNGDLASFRPFIVDAEQLGWISDSWAAQLSQFPDTFHVSEKAVSFSPQIETAAERTEATDRALRQLAHKGEVPAWREELFPVLAAWGEEPRFLVERAACPLFGVRAWGVHMNGYVRKNEEIYLWVAIRAKDKPTFPSMLDNMVAGGQPVGLSPHENMIKECHEEAGIPPEIAGAANLESTLTYLHQPERGLKPDEIFCFDLELPDRFIPQNQDGEIDRFELWPIEEAAARVRDTADFKFNCNLVIIDFLIRHGILTRATDPKFDSINRALYRRP